MTNVNSHTDDHQQALQTYYRWHAPIYDVTRWSFLFGRKNLISILPDLPSRPKILEIGCGTGRNIEILEYNFPNAHVTGIDLSGAMLQKASRKIGQNNQISLVEGSYGSKNLTSGPFDLILLSYSLTMMDNRREQILQQIMDDLSDNGFIAVVDFHKTPFRLFRRWMSRNNVQINSTLLPLLKKYFNPLQVSAHQAYFGLWSYFLFVGQQD